jgi:hypothetical protein
VLGALVEVEDGQPHLPQTENIEGVRAHKLGDDLADAPAEHGWVEEPDRIASCSFICVDRVQSSRADESTTDLNDPLDDPTSSQPAEPARRRRG